jgi:hypothetical protein
MSNDLATLTTKLSVALNDEAYATWAQAELNDLITYAIASLYPHLSRPLDPTSTTVTLVTTTYFYALPAGVMAVSRVDWVDTDSNELGPLSSGWEVVGSPVLGTAKLHVSPVIAQQGGTLRLTGYGRFDATANYVPDDYVRLVLALARAEAYRRMAGDRVRFKEWLASNQTQNVTVNELLLLINEADSEADKLYRLHRVWQRPVPGRT